MDMYRIPGKSGLVLGFSTLVMTFIILQQTARRPIFFLDITPDDWRDHVTDLTYCALESAALFNPNRPVIQLIDTTRKRLQIDHQLLNSYKNLAFQEMSMDELDSGNLREKYNSTSNEEKSNILRMLLMQKFGGSYWDSDTISMQQFPDERCSNWIYHQNYYFDTYAMNFEPNNPYFRIALDSLENVAREHGKISYRFDAKLGVYISSHFCTYNNTPEHQPETVCRGFETRSMDHPCNTNNVLFGPDHLRGNATMKKSTPYELMANFTLLHLAGNDAYQDDLYGMVYADESKYSGYRGLETILRKSCPKVMKAKFNAPS